MSALFLLLYGCTRKEELVLVTETAEVSEEQPALLEDTGSGAYLEGDTGRAAEGADRRTADGDVGNAENRSAADAAEGQSSVIYVHVCGAVERPGVYELEAGSRVYEAVGQAGGFTEDADQNYVNQAQALEDGVMLVIPTREETAAARERELASYTEQGKGSASGKIGIVGDVSQSAQGGEEAGTPDGRININTASETQLCEIPGVGATRAAAIAAYRESHGAFKKPEDIMQVNGIKEGMYEKIKDSICVN